MEVMCHGCFGTEEFAVGVRFPLQGKKTQTNQIYSSPFHHPPPTSVSSEPCRDLQGVGE